MTQPTKVAAELAPPKAFDAACRMVVDYLAASVPMGVWAVSRVVGTRQTMLVTADSAYGIRPGAEVVWATSLCNTMSRGATPRVVPDTARVPDLDEAVSAQAANAIAVGAYVGTPILHPDGSLFGSVVGLNPEPLPDTFLTHESLLDLLSSLLSSVLAADGASVDHARELERAVSDSETDPLTGLLNRRGWERWLAREEQRFARFGDPAAVLVFDLDGLKSVNDGEGHDAGDRLLRRTASSLHGAVRVGDPLARLGGDEFALVAGVGIEDGARLADRLQAVLADADVRCSVGVAPFRLDGGFARAVAEADTAMYANKRERRSRAAHAGAREPLVEVTRG